MSRSRLNDGWILRLWSCLLVSPGACLYEPGKAGAKYSRWTKPPANDLGIEPLPHSSDLSHSLHMAAPFSMTTDIISFITLAIKLVVGAANSMIDMIVIGYREAVNELQDLQWDSKGKWTKLMVLVTNTKEHAFKTLLQEYVCLASLTCGYDRPMSTEKLQLGNFAALLTRLRHLRAAHNSLRGGKTNLQSISLPSNEKSVWAFGTHEQLLAIQGRKSRQ
jgi:hypothetical protein